MKFKVWLEERNDRIEEAILGIFAGTDPITDQQEKEHLLNRSTTEFSREILERVKKLGIVAAVGDQDPGRYHEILQAIDSGIQIRDLISRLRGPIFAPNAEIR